MQLVFTILKSIGILLLGFAVIFIVNAPHDFVINTIAKGTARNQIPFGTQAEVISGCFVFVAGILASMLVYLLGGKQRNLLLIILAILFLLTDLSAAFSQSLSITSIYYRVGIVLILPLEIWIGYFVGRRLKFGSK